MRQYTACKVATKLGQTGNCMIESIRSKRWPRGVFSMASNQKTFNMKVVRLVETVKFAYGIIFIRGHLWPVRVKNQTIVSDLPKSDFG